MHFPKAEEYYKAKIRAHLELMHLNDILRLCHMLQERGLMNFTPSQQQWFFEGQCPLSTHAADHAQRQDPSGMEYQPSMMSAKFAMGSLPVENLPTGLVPRSCSTVSSVQSEFNRLVLPPRSCAPYHCSVGTATGHFDSTIIESDVSGSSRCTSKDNMTFERDGDIQNKPLGRKIQNKPLRKKIDHCVCDSPLVKERALCGPLCELDIVSAERAPCVPSCELDSVHSVVSHRSGLGCVPSCELDSVYSAVSHGSGFEIVKKVLHPVVKQVESKKRESLVAFRRAKFKNSHFLRKYAVSVAS